MRKLFALIFFSALFLPAAALAQVASIADFAVSFSPLRVSFKVDGAFNRNIEEAVRSGLPASFNFIVKLERVNRFFLNESVGEWEFRHTVKYNSFRDEYEIALDEAGGQPFKVKDAAEMKRLMASCQEVTVQPAHLVAGEVYRVWVKAELDSVDLPPVLDSVLFFLEAFDFETDWQYYEFTHAI